MWSLRKTSPNVSLGITCKIFDGKVHYPLRFTFIATHKLALFLFIYFFLSKLSTIYPYTDICICTFAYIYIHTCTHIGIRPDDTKTAPYCFFINSKAKKLTKIL